MKPSTLKSLHETYCETSKRDCFFFDRKSMKYFGDTMSNYRVTPVRISLNWHKDGQFNPNNYQETPIEINALRLDRKRPVKNGCTASQYFTDYGAQLGSDESEVTA